MADVYAFRIIVDQLDTCYRVLGAVHQSLQNRFPEDLRTTLPFPNPMVTVVGIPYCSVVPMEYPLKSDSHTGYTELAESRDRSSLVVQGGR